MWAEHIKAVKITLLVYGFVVVAILLHVFAVYILDGSLSLKWNKYDLRSVGDTTG